jgi:hypothetical protein
MRGDVPTDLRARRRFRHELRSAARLRGRRVARVLDAGTFADGGPFVVMELLEGRDLAALVGALEPQGPIAAEGAARRVRTLLETRPVKRSSRAARIALVVLAVAATASAAVHALRPANRASSSTQPDTIASASIDGLASMPTASVTLSATTSSTTNAACVPSISAPTSKPSRRKGDKAIALAPSVASVVVAAPAPIASTASAAPAGASLMDDPMLDDR